MSPFALILIPLCSVLNRGRGSHFWNTLPSTVESRLLFAVIIGAFMCALTADPYVFPVVLAGLMLWATPSWDKYFTACIGNDLSHGKLWGLATMGLRGLLIYPTFLGLALLGHPIAYLIGLAGLLQGIPYALGGILSESYCIAIAEYIWGASIGLMFYLTL